MAAALIYVYSSPSRISIRVYILPLFLLLCLLPREKKKGPLSFRVEDLYQIFELAAVFHHVVELPLGIVKLFRTSDPRHVG